MPVIVQNKYELWGFGAKCCLTPNHLPSSHSVPEHAMYHGSPPVECHLVQFKTNPARTGRPSESIANMRRQDLRLAPVGSGCRLSLRFDLGSFPMNQATS